MKLTVEYKVKVSNEVVEMQSKRFTKLGDCLCYLNSRYNESYEEYYNQTSVFFFWSIRDFEEINLHGVLEVSSMNFIEQLFNVKRELSHFQKE